MTVAVLFGQTEVDEVCDCLNGAKQRGQSQKKPLLSPSHGFSEPGVPIIGKHCDADCHQGEEAGNKSQSTNALTEIGPSTHSSSRAISAERCSRVP
jgi:hypothetical protein